MAGNKKKISKENEPLEKSSMCLQHAISFCVLHQQITEMIHKQSIELSWSAYHLHIHDVHQYGKSLCCMEVIESFRQFL